MAQKTKLTCVNNTENPYKFILSADGNVIDHTTILNAALRNSEGLTLADSEVDATDWDFTDSNFITVKLGLGQISAGEHTCHLIVKTLLYPIGITWDGTKTILTVLP